MYVSFLYICENDMLIYIYILIYSAHWILCVPACERAPAQIDVHKSMKRAYLVRSHSGGLRPCLQQVTITPFIPLLPPPMFWFLLKVLCQCPPSRVPLPCMLIELCIFYYCCQGKIRDTFSKGALGGQWTQRGVLLLLHYQSSSHLNGAGLWALCLSLKQWLRTVFRYNQSLGNRPIPIWHTPRHRRPHGRTHTHTLKPCAAAGSI